MGTGMKEEVKLACKVKSSPDPMSYIWQLDSNGTIIDIPNNNFNVDGRLSILRYTPKTRFDYGKLLCWASNGVGKQNEPCRFELVSAVLPTPLTNCTASNNDTHTVYIDCLGGTENGLPELFVAEVYDISKDRLLRNLSSSQPNFILEELDPGSGYTIHAYTVNIRGPSDILSFHAFTEPLVKKSFGEFFFLRFIIYIYLK